ncbi:sensor histidine kinase [Ornithinimicrobium pratense]|uniref:histidine kinase n=1 Tax=Ornithinimicrobium pratense TaxID=2593973 RepID=A0A5J6V7N3_9MICO|nr:histidine kinase [Ornithinimicrobium pratense]QFG69815.1 sensor histidine kinase [Ornithinimicrobium pratense]
MDHNARPSRPRAWWDAAQAGAKDAQAWAEELAGDRAVMLRSLFPDFLLVVVLIVLNTLISATAGTGYWLVGVLLLLPLVVRRRSPVVAALGVAAVCLLQVWALDGPHFGNIAVPIVVYSAAVFGTHAQSRGVLLLGLFGSGVAALDWARLESGMNWRSELLYAAFNAFFIAMVVAVAWVLGDVVRRRKDVVAKLEQQNRALARDQAQRTLLAAQGERASIAREMHDVVAHSLAVVVVQADGGLYAARTALEQPPASAPDRAALERAAATLETLAHTARASLAETRKLVGVLRDEGAGAEYTPLQGLEYLTELAQRVRDSGREVHVAVRGRIDDLPREVDLAAYRVVQESLTNALKHAGPDAVIDVDVLRTPAVLLVRVTDDGFGLDPNSDGEGNGILGMAERVEVLGGSVQAGPRPRGGWEVVATLPAQAQAQTQTPSRGVTHGRGNGIPSADVPTPGGPQ